MDENKISISWDDLRTRQVEQRVSAMQAMRRNREYAQITDAAPEQPKRLKNLWYNAAVYMSLFGLLGGLAAWGCGTMLHFKNSARIEASNAKGEIEKVRSDVLLTPENRSMIVDQMAREFRNNPYFVIYVNEAMTDAQKKAAIERISTRDKNREFISNVLVFGISGMLIAMFLSFAEPLVSRNIPSAIINGSVGATLGIVGGVIVALFAEKLYAALGGVDGSVTTGRQIFAPLHPVGRRRALPHTRPGAGHAQRQKAPHRRHRRSRRRRGRRCAVRRHPQHDRQPGPRAGSSGSAASASSPASRPRWSKAPPRAAGSRSPPDSLPASSSSFIATPPSSAPRPTTRFTSSKIRASAGATPPSTSSTAAASSKTSRSASRPPSTDAPSLARVCAAETRFRSAATRFVFQEKQPSELAPKSNGAEIRK